MRIGIDCLSVNPSYKGGVNTYLLGLLDGFTESKKHTYIIFCRSDNKYFFEKYVIEENFSVVSIDHFKTRFKKLILAIPYFLNSIKLWELALNFYTRYSGVNNKIEGKCDVLYTATATLNIYNLKIPTILSMHDIQQYHYPEFFTKKILKLRKLTYVNSAKHATFLQASSQFIKNDLLMHFKWLKNEQVVVISEGVSIRDFSTKTAINIYKKFNLPNKFLFFPAQLWQHKNHITVLKALKKLKKKNIVIPLVMSGAKFSASNDILDYIKVNNMDYVYYLGKVDFGDLITLYQKATFFITAVLYESSSLPILEAASSNTPIIASKTPPNIEMSKNININMFDPLDIDDCSRVIEKCWFEDINSINEQTSENRKNIGLYSWSKVADKYLDFMKYNINVSPRDL